MKIKLIVKSAAILLLLGSMQAQAAVVGLSFSKLTGDTAQATGVFKSDLSALPLTQLASITVRDSSNTEGSPGIWSGFDLDAIRLSTSDCATAACAAGLAGISVFDFVNEVLFNPGTMDATAEPGLIGPCLAGTTGGGCNVDNTIATLGAFDGAFGLPGVGSGFLSLGRGGVISFNLTPLLALGGPLFMYLGEVGNNGETLRGAVEVSDVPKVVPVPAAIWLFGSALVGFIGISRRRRIG